MVHGNNIRLKLMMILDTSHNIITNSGLMVHILSGSGSQLLKMVGNITITVWIIRLLNGLDTLLSKTLQVAMTIATLITLVNNGVSTVIPMRLAIQAN